MPKKERDKETESPIADLGSCRVFLEASGAGICKVDLQGHLIGADQRFCRLVGRRRKTLMGQRYVDLLCPEDREADLGLEDSSAPVGKHWHAELRYHRNNGGHVWAVVYGSWSGEPHDPSRHWLAASVDVTDRKTAEYRLRSSEARLAAIFDHSPVGLSELSMQGDFLRVNDQLCKMLGRSHEQLLGMNVADVTHPDDVRRTRAALAELTATGIPNSIDKRYIRRDGSIVFANSAISITAAVGGQPDMILAVTVDLTERQQMQSEILAELESGKRLQAISTELIRSGEEPGLFTRLLDAATDIVQADSGAIYLKHDQADRLELLAESRVGQGLHSVCQKEALDLPTPVAEAMRRKTHVVVADCASDDRFVGSQIARDYLAAGVRGFVVTPLVARSGLPLGAISSHYREPIDVDERHARMLDIVARQAADLVERKQSEAALRESEERYRTLFESIDEGFCIIEVIFVGSDKVEDLRFLQVNPAFEKHSGLKNALGKRQQEIIPHLESSWTDILGQIALSGKAKRFINRIRELGRWFAVYAFRFGDPTKRQVAIIFRDITEHVHEQAELKQADRRKNEFLAVLAHELRNPLAPIRSGLQVLRLSDRSERDHHHLLALMERQMEHLVRLVDDLLDLSRITQGKIHIHREKAELPDIIESAVEGSRELFTSAAVTLEVRIPSEIICVEADAARLAQVFSNLLNNAAKYTPAGGRVWLDAKVAGKNLTVKVRDTGAGIPADMLRDIFDPFVQVDHRLLRRQDGLGVGLSLVQTLVQLHGGKVIARSEGPGQGSEFVVKLPGIVVPPESIRPNARAQSDEALGGHRILVVDDNMDAANALAMMLQMIGNEVRVAYRGDQGISLARQFSPELVLLDLGMPELDGYEVARSIRKGSWGRSMVISALTGWGQDEDRRRSKEAGFDYHLVKPVDIGALRQLLSTLPQSTQH